MQQRQKVSIEEKVKNVQAYLIREISISEATRRKWSGTVKGRRMGAQLSSRRSGSLSAAQKPCI